MDSFRVYEALEAGCIPVTLSRTEKIQIYPSYWHAIMQNVKLYEIPFVIQNNWKDCFQKVQKICKNNQHVETQKRCQEFWQQVKKNCINEIEKKLNLLS
jgi:hypothetical protein